jgi:hypothetical protein
MQTVEYNGALLLLLLLLFISYARNPNQATQTLDTEQVKTQQQNTIQAIQVIKTQQSDIQNTTPKRTTECITSENTTCLKCSSQGPK